MTRDPATKPKGVAVLGSTGSIGTTALRVLDRQRQRFQVRALTANSNGALLREQVRQFQPSFVGMVESNADGDDAWESGTDALVAAATRDDVDIVLNAIVGAAGLDATLAWTDAPLVKASEVALVFLLAAHLGGGLRLLFVEFRGFRAAWQPALIAAVLAGATLCALLFALNLL
jgi:hypothetical protein